MYKINGKYNEAIVYASTAEQSAVDQLKMICDMEIYKDSRIRIMPDVHAGAGCTIGTTMTLHGAVTPNMVGVDIVSGKDFFAALGAVGGELFTQRRVVCGEDFGGQKRGVGGAAGAHADGDRFNTCTHTGAHA